MTGRREGTATGFRNAARTDAGAHHSLPAVLQDLRDFRGAVEAAREAAPARGP